MGAAGYPPYVPPCAYHNQNRQAATQSDFPLYLYEGPIISNSPPQVHLSIGLNPPEADVTSRTSNLITRLNHFVRVIEARNGGGNRGATQDVIERNTFPHKYKRVRRISCTEDDESEKCTICLCQFEIESDVR